MLQKSAYDLRDGLKKTHCRMLLWTETIHAKLANYCEVYNDFQVFRMDYMPWDRWNKGKR